MIKTLELCVRNNVCYYEKVSIRSGGWETCPDSPFVKNKIFSFASAGRGRLCVGFGSEF